MYYAVLRAFFHGLSLPLAALLVATLALLIAWELLKLVGEA